MNFRVAARNIFTPDRYVVFGFHAGQGTIFTPEVFRGSEANGFYASHLEATQDIRDAFETPGRIRDEFRRATHGWTFLPVRIDDGYTNGVLDAVRLGGLG